MILTQQLKHRLRSSLGGQAIQGVVLTALHVFLVYYSVDYIWMDFSWGDFLATVILNIWFVYLVWSTYIGIGKNILKTVKGLNHSLN